MIDTYAIEEAFKNAVAEFCASHGGILVNARLQHQYSPYSDLDQFSFSFNIMRPQNSAAAQEDAK